MCIWIGELFYSRGEEEIPEECGCRRFSSKLGKGETIAHVSIAKIKPSKVNSLTAKQQKPSSDGL